MQRDEKIWELARVDMTMSAEERYARIAALLECERLKAEEARNSLAMLETGKIQLPIGSDGEFVYVGQSMTDGERYAVCSGVSDLDVFFVEGGTLKRNRAKSWRTCAIGKDGSEIRRGQTVYGEDGKAWKVNGFAPERGTTCRVSDEQYSILAVDKNGIEKALKPRWLTHEPPDSWERICADLRQMDADNLIALGNGQYVEDTRHDEIAVRIERMAKA